MGYGMHSIDTSNCIAHYSKLNNLANILHDKQLLIGSVSKLSDARESSMRWLDTIGYGHTSDITQQRKAEKLIKDAGIFLRVLCCASPKLNINGANPIENAIYGRPRMWAQYGDNSNGFCIVLDKELLGLEIRQHAQKTEHLIEDKVEYHDWLHLVSSSVCIEYGDGVGLTQSAFDVVSNNEMHRSIYFKKSKDWKGEEEYRYLLYRETCENVFISIQKAVIGVVLGCNFPRNQFSQAKGYCNELGCECYALNYSHPQYQLEKL